MNIFDKKLKTIAKPDLPIAPIELYQTCPYKENYGYLRGIQEEVLRAWHNIRGQRDVICKMNTGSGKTLTGLIMLYSKLVEKVGPAIYLCPDKQLLDQTVELAGLYGIPICKFEGGNAIPTDFVNGKSILITTFSKVFNGRSIFTKGNIKIGSLLLDDAHKCMDIARESSTVKVPRNHVISKKLFSLFTDALKHQLPGTFYRLEIEDPTTLMKVPYWSWIDYRDEVLKIINDYVDSIASDYDNQEDIKFSWPIISDNILSYDCYFSGNDMEISPIHVPYHEIPPFHEAKFRYILSATFEDDYDLIKDLGIAANSVLDPIVPADRKDVGKRLILAPSRFDPGLNVDVTREFIANTYPAMGYNTVVLVPSSARAGIWQELGATIVDRKNITGAIANLNSSKGNFFVFLNRYDGIDLHNDLCRILVIDGLPRYNSLKEQYEEARLEALSAGKKAQIIEQGLGRATRSGGDYSVIYIVSDDLVNFLGFEKNLSHFTPLTKAQLSLGLELLDGETSEDPISTIAETAGLCLAQNPSWHQIHTQALIGSEKEGLTDEKKRKITLADIESDALEKFRKRKYTEASNIILEQIINTGLVSGKEKAWYYQLSAQLLYKDNKVESNNLQIKACDIGTQMFHPIDSHIYKKLKNKGTQGANVRKVIEGFSTPQDVVLYVKEMLDSLQYHPDITADRFEKALANIGKFLGFAAQQPEKDLGNGPDVLWAMTNGIYLIQEAKSRATHDEITRANIGQLLQSEEWFKEQYPDKVNDYYAVTLQATNKKGDNVNVSTNIRVLDAASLEKLHNNLRDFANALQGKLNNSHTDEAINKLLVAYNLTSELFVQTYLKEIKR